MGRSKKEQPAEPEEMTEAERRRVQTAEADKEWEAAGAAPMSFENTMEAAAAAEAARQAEEREAAEDAEKERKLKMAIARMGGAELKGGAARAMIEMVQGALRGMRGVTPWEKLSESQQKKIIREAEYAAELIVRAAVNGVAGNAFPAIACGLEAVNIKDGFKLTLKAPGGHNHRHHLFDSVGKNVVLVLANPDVYMQHDPIEPVKDEPPLPLGEPPARAPEAASPSDDGVAAADSEEGGQGTTEPESDEATTGDNSAETVH